MRGRGTKFINNQSEKGVSSTLTPSDHESNWPWRRAASVRVENSRRLRGAVDRDDSAVCTPQTYLERATEVSVHCVDSSLTSDRNDAHMFA